MELLQIEAQRIKKWLKEGRDSDVYCKNDAYDYAIQKALYLQELLTSSSTFFHSVKVESDQSLF
jgi:uncharacterized protein YecE (DUF72 family)